MMAGEERGEGGVRGNSSRNQYPLRKEGVWSWDNALLLV